MKLLRLVLTWVVALYVLFVEWGWAPLQAALARLGALPGLRWIQAWVQRLPPYAALALFVVPSVLLLPVKLGCLWLMRHGHVALGLTVIVLAKLIGTAVVARIFTLTQPALMRLGWFERIYTRWSTWKHAAMAHVRASRVWRLAQVFKRQVRRAFGARV